MWDRPHPGVYRVAGQTESRLADLWVAALAVGPTAVISHESAALIHGAERLRPQPISLNVRHGWHHRLPGIVVHQIDDLVERHQRTWNGLTVSTPPRTVVDLGATQPERAVGQVADDLVRSRRTSYSAISSVLASIARPGKPGLHIVARVLEARTGGYVPSASALEEALFATLAAGGLPPPARQIPLPGRGPVRGLVDGAYLDAKIVLEADGRRWHARVEAARRDRERDAQVVRAGWVPLRFVHEQIVEEPAEVCAIVAEARARRLALLNPAA